MEVIAIVLKTLKNILFDRLEMMQPVYDVDWQNLQWVLTVPAVWTQKEKKLMREAACLVR